MKLSEFMHRQMEREFTESGLPCAVWANPHGFRCGYVGVPKGHPLFKRDIYYTDMPEVDVDGGVTYSNGNDEWWVFGWDANHSWHLRDESIMSDECKRFLIHDLHEPYAVMIDVDMAERETRRFARQLAKIGKARR